jgi:hypothetical protein
MKIRLVLAAGAAVAVVTAVPASALVALQTTPSGGPKGNPNARDGTDERVCSDSGGERRTITYTGPLSLWPPNHKMRDYTIVARDSDGGNVGLMTVVTSSQPDNGVGDGNTDGDFVDNTPAGADMGDGEATNTGQIRSERSGKDSGKAGRTYTFNSTATWEDGSTCMETFTAHVPHDQGKNTPGSNGGGRKRSARR